MTVPDANRAIDAIWRIESPKLIAGLTRMVGDIGVAEEPAQDAVVAALVQWPESGIPATPERGYDDRQAPRRRPIPARRCPSSQ